MATDKSTLEKLKKVATPGDTSRGLNYTTLFDFARAEIGPTAPRDVDPTGQGTRVDFFSYPITEYLDTAWKIAERLAPKYGSYDAVFFELGKRTVDGFLASVVGKTIFSMAGRDPRRVLAAGPGAFKSAVSYGERSMEFTGEKSCRYLFKRDFMPHSFHRGVIVAALHATEARNPRVEAREVAFMETVFEIAWD
ncbi:MAG TPA: TIGR02265 family protein [Anaeromyxobacteraceae bacterium]|nr:TIGR02265 family protein [Anaeromyxobacteraceae bacterium]